jgi:K+-sensing histidine kinase KdpD
MEDDEMEKILACLTHSPSSLWAGVHAMNLAKRINAHVTFLLFIDQKADGGGEKKRRQDLSKIILEIESMISEGRADGIPVDYCQVQGDFATELINFAGQNKITLIVVASPVRHDIQDKGFSDFVEKLHHRLECRIEIVQMKP